MSGVHKYAMKPCAILRGMFSDFLRGLPQGFLNAYRGNLVWLHVAAALLTAPLVLGGFDWWYFEHTRGALWQSLTLPAAIIGFFVPVILPVLLYAWGSWRKHARLKFIGIAIAQAEILGWCISSLYKAFTGRIQPEFLTNTSTTDISHQFNFGIWQHGIFWGWPSSHTAVAVAMATVVVLLVKNKVIRGVAVLYALFIGVGVSVSIHWFSDFIAGTLVGVAAGVAVARLIQGRK